MDTLNYYEIGQQIRKFRKAQGLSQEELAEKVHISTTHMSHIETGNTKLSLPVFVDIAIALQVHLDDLLNNSREITYSQAMQDMSEILNNCSTQQIQILSDMLKAMKIALDKHI